MDMTQDVLLGHAKAAGIEPSKEFLARNATHRDRLTLDDERVALEVCYDIVGDRVVLMRSNLPLCLTGHDHHIGIGNEYLAGWWRGGHHYWGEGYCDYRVTAMRTYEYSGGDYECIELSKVR